MILAITKENENLVNEVCNEVRFESLYILNNIDSLKKFVIQKARNLNYFNQIIIDITSTPETEDEIVQSIVAIKKMYHIRIIILALNFNKDKFLIQKLYNEGIYNIVDSNNTFKQKEQLKSYIIGIGCKKHRDVIRRRKKTKIKKKKTLFNFIKNIFGGFLN